MSSPMTLLRSARCSKVIRPQRNRLSIWLFICVSLCVCVCVFDRERAEGWERGSIFERPISWSRTNFYANAMTWFRKKLPLLGFAGRVGLTCPNTQLSSLTHKALHMLILPDLTNSPCDAFYCIGTRLEGNTFHVRDKQLKGRITPHGWWRPAN